MSNTSAIAVFRFLEWRSAIASKTSVIASNLSVVVAGKCDLATDFSVRVSDFPVVVAEESDLATEIPATPPDKSVAATEKSATLPDLSAALSQACVVKTAIALLRSHLI